MKLHVRNTVVGFAVLVGVCAVWYAASVASKQQSQQEDKKDKERTAEDKCK